MKKWLVIAVLAAGIVALLRMTDRRRVEGGTEGSRPTIWDKLAAQMENMPEDFPPRVMFDNVANTNETAQRILEILEHKPLAAVTQEGQGTSG